MIYSTETLHDILSRYQEMSAEEGEMYLENLGFSAFRGATPYENLIASIEDGEDVI